MTELEDLLIVVVDRLVNIYINKLYNYTKHEQNKN